MAMPGHALDWVPELPAELLQRITAGMGMADMASALSVNSAWYRALGRAVLELRPQGYPPRFGNVVHPLAARFPELQRLYLDDCVTALVTNAQACEACKLRRLTHLSLRGCRAVFDTAIAGLSSLTGLQELNLSGCARLSVRTLSSLRCSERLACLDLRKSDWLRDEDMRVLCQMTGIRVLSLADCKNLSAGVSLLGMLPNLESLNLSGLYNLSDSDVDPLVGATKLEELVIDRCRELRGEFLGELARLPRLRVLSMQGCPLLSNSALSRLSGAPALKQLVLDECELITDEGLAHLATLSTLRMLSMRECSRVAGTGFAAFAALSHSIRSLNLSFCLAFSQPGSEAVGALPHLAELDLSMCERVDCGMLRALSRLSGLRMLRLTGCTCVRDNGLRHLARGCTSLRSLDLSYCCSIRDEGVVALAGLPSLSSIVLVKCKHVGDAAAMALTAARQLQEVSLSFTAVTPAGVETLAAARRLKELPILGCHLLRPDAQAAQPGSADDWRGVVQWRERRSLGYC